MKLNSDPDNVWDLELTVSKYEESGNVFKSFMFLGIGYIIGSMKYVGIYNTLCSNTFKMIVFLGVMTWIIKYILKKIS